MDLKGKRLAVIGFGRSGQAATRLLLAEGARVRVIDRDADAPRRVASLGLERAGVEFECGPHVDGQLGDAEMIVLSPGVPPGIPPLAEARRRGLPILGEAELGARLSRGRLLGITGSNGKSTTVCLAESMLKAAGLPARAGGNLGRPLCELLLEENTEDNITCLELSSFQCETLEEAELAVVALLNISPDHLDRYESFAAYAEAKLHLLDQQSEAGAAVLPSHCSWAEDAASRARGRVTWFGKGELPGPGVAVTGDSLFSTLPEGKGELSVPTTPWSSTPHDLLNAAAAATVALLAGATPDAVGEGLQSFRGLPHRSVHVPTTRGPRFVDDSKATNVAAAVVSILGSPSGVVVLLGGRHKGGDLAPLLEALVAQEASAVLLGEASDEFASLLQGGPTYRRAHTMDEAVSFAALLAEESGTVLLAPACASFDMFDSFEHRGRAFQEAARRQFGDAHQGGGHE